MISRDRYSRQVFGSLEKGHAICSGELHISSKTSPEVVLGSGKDGTFAHRTLVELPIMS